MPHFAANGGPPLLAIFPYLCFGPSCGNAFCLSLQNISTLGETFYLIPQTGAAAATINMVEPIAESMRKGKEMSVGAWTMPKRSARIVSKDHRSEQSLHYGVRCLFDDLPERLQELIHRHPDFGDASTRAWRRVLINHGFFTPPLGELVVPVRSILRSREDASSLTSLSPGIASRTEFLTLMRLYDEHFPTRFFIARSMETGICYWAEEVF